MTIYLASGNEHKKREFTGIFSGHSLVLPKEKGIVFDPDETGTTFLDNALVKARTLYSLVKAPVIADDSGLCIDSLNGQPGVYSARYGSKENIQLTAEEKNLLVLHKMQGVHNRRCRFVCCLVCMLDEYRIYTVQEVCEGVIGEDMRGLHGFGYDPIVYLPEYGKTVAELTAAEKNTYSHRAKAGKAIARFLS
ncbi:MAG: RdgB/HAM1 family non-canonical purine NTP pyrophosphatase [Treponema sp.]